MGQRPDLSTFGSEAQQVHVDGRSCGKVFNHIWTVSGTALPGCLSNAFARLALTSLSNDRGKKRLKNCKTEQSHKGPTAQLRVYMLCHAVAALLTALEQKRSLGNVTAGLTTAVPHGFPFGAHTYSSGCKGRVNYHVDIP